MNWYTKQAQTRVVHSGEDHRVYEIIRKLQEFNVPEIPGVARGEPNWTHETTAKIGVKTFDERGEYAAEQFFLDVLASAGMGDTDVEEDVNWGEPGTSEYSMMRDIVRILTQIDAQGNPIDRFKDLSEEEEFEENTDI